MRDLNVQDRYEMAIVSQYGDGVVVWRKDHATPMADATIFALVAGDEGPDFVCVQAWTSPGGDAHLKAEGFPVAALEAKIPLLQWHAYRIEPSEGSDAEIVSKAVGGYLQGLWSGGSTEFHVYLTKVRRDDGDRLMAVLLDRAGGQRMASIDFGVGIDEFMAEARSLSGSPTP